MTFLMVIALLLYLAGAFFAIIVFANRSGSQNSRLKGLITAGFAAHTIALVVDWWQLGHFPIVNPKEVSSFIAWAIVAYYLGMSVRYQARALPTFLLPLVFVFMLGSLLIATPDRPLPQLLEGAIAANTLTRIIFPVHVTLVILSYAAFILTFVSGVMYLIQEHDLKAKNFGGAFQLLPALNTCDEIGYRSLTIGFVLLTLGVATGIIWNNQRDGRYWHNDPKEVMALVTWLVYLFIIHYRLTAGWRGRRVALLSIIGFIVVLLTWLGARTLGGYHVFG
ncbi:MAG: cytochrome c biogenesis protein CcsA [Acidobacteriota bacterium]|nr:MAG: cytochrome c biogenesis protein CcsA [Acidobacteriota bacterium]